MTASRRLLRAAVRALDAVHERLGRVAAIVDAWAEAADAAERKSRRPPGLRCFVCDHVILREGPARLRCMACERAKGARPS